MGNVTKLHLVEVGESFEVSPDQILENWKGKLSKLVLIGIEDGEIMCASSHGVFEALWLVEKAKRDILI